MDATSQLSGSVNSKLHENIWRMLTHILSQDNKWKMWFGKLATIRKIASDEDCCYFGVPFPCCSAQSQCFAQLLFSTSHCGYKFSTTIPHAETKCHCCQTESLNDIKWQLIKEFQGVLFYFHNLTRRTVTLLLSHLTGAVIPLLRTTNPSSSPHDAQELNMSLLTL